MLAPQSAMSGLAERSSVNQKPAASASSPGGEETGSSERSERHFLCCSFLGEQLTELGGASACLVRRGTREPFPHSAILSILPKHPCLSVSIRLPRLPRSTWFHVVVKIGHFTKNKPNQIKRKSGQNDINPSSLQIWLAHGMGL
jgi:hypothetical protein